VRLHVLVEGPSEKRLLDELLRRVIPGHTFQVHPHQGKGRLPPTPGSRPGRAGRGVLDQLGAKLRAWGRTLDPATERVVLLVDLDDDDEGECRRLRERLDRFVEAIDPRPLVLIRIAIEEVEAWYLADWKAVKRAFPRAGRTAELRDYEQDSICGTWELFQQVIKDPVERKPYWAERMGPVLDVENALSPSFAAFVRGVRRHAGDPA
jgi:hypothetical protein